VNWRIPGTAEVSDPRRFWPAADEGKSGDNAELCGVELILVQRVPLDRSSEPVQRFLHPVLCRFDAWSFSPHTTPHR
jgi:hypothetical protein